jgi:multiple sugar transport system substrate-binding protein
MFGVTDYSKDPGPNMFTLKLNESYMSFVDLENKTADFTDGLFAQMLESIKEYAENGYIASGAVSGGNDAEAIMQRRAQQSEDRFYYKLKNNFTLVQHFNRESGRRFMMAGGMGVGIEDDDEIAGVQKLIDGSVPFTYSQAYGINENSANKRTAWEFLKFLLSDEMQTSANLSPLSLPINNFARAQKAEAMVSGAYFGMGDDELDETQRVILENYTNVIESFSDQINVFVIRDSIVDDMIASEVGYFFDGTKTADEVARTLQNRVELYLNE